MLEGAQRMIADLKSDPNKKERTGVEAARTFEVITNDTKRPASAHAPLKYRYLIRSHLV